MSSQNPGSDWESAASSDGTVQPSGGDDDGLFGFSISYPGRNGWKTVFIGGVLGLFFWLIVPALILAGYFVRTTKAAGEGRPEPPEFDDWGGMLVDGLGLFLVFIPVIVVYSLVVVVAMEVHLAAYLVASIALAYPLPAIYVNYSMSDSWLGAYDVSGLQTLVTDKTYVFGFLLYAFVINGIGVIVAMVLLGLSLLTIVGWIILWPMIYFYWYGIDASLWGRVYNRIHRA
ncbi:DUF4013 domain-containing protein [Natronobacterium texcoconense]|uniref:DUF4013 domain-containing protein n=1 Tax=Natronobacterium texcoconense TaxID=1095778 RepID=A0A1H1G5D1_NATTX|nr:DUF4013 domain-containing protein [Natronobacterium texcoconense]SDR08353.1 Protein of unknown function [Natronobacterium texcoconense]